MVLGAGEIAERARAAGATILSHGEAGCLEAGKFPPTVVVGAPHDGILLREEIFGPVLSVIRVGTLDEAIAINNDVRYGLSSSVYTRDVEAA